MFTIQQRSVLLAAVLMALLSTTAHAQTTASGDEVMIEEIVVTGISRTLNVARDIKRRSDQIVDAVVADDIGRLPDANVAESLQRVSGVQVDRGIGAGTSVSIRGIRENVFLVNGREIIESGGRGGNGPDSLETSTYGMLALIPSGLVSRLEVTKLSGADQIEGAIGGVVELVTRKPLDDSGFQASANVSAAYGGLSGDTTPGGFLLLSNTFANDTFGVLVSASYDKLQVREDGFNTFSGYTRLSEGALSFTNINAYNAVTGPDGQLLNPDPNGDGVNGIIHQDPRYWQIDDERERVGFSFTGQWRPNERTEITYDVLHSQVDSVRDRHWLGVFATFGPHSNAVLNENEVLVTGIVTRPTTTNVEYANYDASVTTHALNLDWNLTDKVNVFAEAALTNSDSRGTQSFVRLQSAGVPTPYDYRPRVPVIGFDSALVNDPDALALTIFFDSYSENENKNLAFRLDFDHELNDRFSLDYGLRVSNLDTDFVLNPTDIRPNTPATELQSYITTFSSPDYFQGEVPNLPRSYLSFIPALRAGGCTALSDFYRNSPDPTVVTAFTDGRAAGLGCDTRSDRVTNVEEDINAFYAKLNFSGDLGNIPFSGNIGARQVMRDMTSTGTRTNPNGSTEPFVTNVDNNELLPSAIVRFDLTDEWVVRVGAATVLAFPNTTDLRNDIQINGDGTGRGGAPGLDPFKADQFDLSLEYYFADSALVSLGLFYKDIKSFIISSTALEQIPNYTNPNDGSNTAIISRRLNGGGGKVNGFELLYQQTYKGLPSPFDGLGVMANYTFIDSETPFEDPAGNVLPQPGLSENNINVIAYWESGPFGIRAAYNWRDEYLDRLGFSGSGVFADSYEDLALSFRWRMTDLISLDLEAANVLDSRQRLFNTFKEATRSNVEYGTTYILTVRASLN